MSFERINQDKENEAKTAALLALIPDNLVTSGSSFSGVSDSITGTAYGITAFAGGGQLAATQLASEYNVITTCATAKDSVKLPAASAGQVVIVHNSGAASCDVFPYTSDSINTLAINLAIAVPVGAEVKFTGMSDNWWVSDSVALSLTAPTTQRGSLILRAANSAAETETVITNSSQAAARIYSIPDAGANASFVMSTGTTASQRVVSGDAVDTVGAYTITTADSGTLFLFDKTDGLTFTLPPAVVGLTYEFFISVSSTAANYGIDTDGTDNFEGLVIVHDKDQIYTAVTLLQHAAIADGTPTHVDMTATTTGGLQGGHLKVTAITTDRWMIHGDLVGDANVVTCFS